MQNNKVLLITGGMGEIATAIIREIYADFQTVVALDINDKECDKWMGSLKNDDINNVIYRKMDVTNFEECEAVISGIIKRYHRVDALVNNAGITNDVVFHKMTVAQWDKVLRVNLDGMFNVTRNVVNAMREQEYGRIINISSVNGQKGQFSQANYAASKAGVFGFTKSLAQELMSKNITVNSVAPGYVNTHLMEGIRPDILEKIIEMIPAKRLAEPSEVAWVVKFLLDKKSEYITGANFNVNGGLYM